jgi:hypothetical protein
MRHPAFVVVRPFPHDFAGLLVHDVHRVDVSRVHQDVAGPEALIARVEPFVLGDGSHRVDVNPVAFGRGLRELVQVEVIVRVPLPDDLSGRIHLVEIAAQLVLDASSFPGRPHLGGLDVLDLFLELVGNRLVRDEELVAVREHAQVVDGADALMLPHDIAVPVVLEDGLVRPGVHKVAVGEQPAPLVEVGRDLPGVNDRAVHVDEPDVVSDLAFGSDFGIRMVPRCGVIRDEDVAAVALGRFVDRGAGGIYRRPGDEHADQSK